MILTDNNLRLSEIVGDTYFLTYRVNGVFGKDEQVIHIAISRGDMEQLMRYKHNE